jgi:OmpA-OmpF porin, OOP family
MNGRLAPLLVAGALAAGCAGSHLRARSSAVGKLIRAAHDNGALICAPIELALAESHNDFAGVELDEGDYYRALAELEVAERNASEALRKSPKGKCVRRVAAVGPGDQDGDGIPDQRDECPTRPEDKDGYQDNDGCPERDNDSDGLDDPVDECPNKAEDKDNFEDQDGCPDEDNDKDKLSDPVDQCPDLAEDPDGNADDDGCPDCDDDGDGVAECPEPLDKCPGEKGQPPDGCKYKNVVVTDTRIEIKQTIFFETGRATIKSVSFSLLDEVAQALKDNPSIRVRIEGHTDSQGKDRYNLKLSRGRAASVRKYLIGRGIAARRMVSKGYGETRPVSDNRTAEGRSQNRRVEFVITGR